MPTHLTYESHRNTFRILDAVLALGTDPVRKESSKMRLRRSGSQRSEDNLNEQLGKGRAQGGRRPRDLNGAGSCDGRAWLASSRGRRAHGERIEA